MEDQETKTCTNCKRDIPAVNFTTHTVHCARNIGMCPVCKEPIPHAELEEHNNKMHKLRPCKQCGESVCGTDLEDHIRDSCGQTIKSCRFCELELHRRSLPAHEAYCGTRTEPCTDCGEWVMIKYRQLHLDSNHGFLRLDDDPEPPKKETRPKPAKPLTAKILNMPSSSNGFSRPASILKNVNMSNPTVSTASTSQGETVAQIIRSQMHNGMKPAMKRTNDKPQINTDVVGVDKVHKELSSRGAVKKRQAPAPPAAAPAPLSPASQRREQHAYPAMLRAQREERQRREQTAYNLSVGLPPVLSPAAKLDKLRKMDAMINGEVDFSQQPRPKPREPPANLSNNRNCARPSHQTPPVGSTSDRAERPSRQKARDRELQADGEDYEKRRQEFKNLKPMSQEQFMQRFNEMHLQRGDDAQPRPDRSGDRFSEIKSSLRELRRGLNEVTAPYNSPSNATALLSNATGGEDVRLPCEFCGAPVPADDLVRHQTGCRPDLAQYRPRSLSPVEPLQPRPADDLDDIPVIPCEFCTQALPLYLISEHQERCGRDRDFEDTNAFAI